MTRPTTLAVALALATCASQSLAQPSPVAIQFQVNAYETGNQSRPSVCMAANGDFVVSFLDHYPFVAGSQPGQDGSGTTACLRPVSAGGVPGFELFANTYTTGDQLDLSVACAPGGDFLATWTDRPNSEDGGRTAFVGGAFEDIGFPKASPFVIAGEELVGGPTDQGAVCRGSGDSFVATWIDGSDALFGRRYDAEGAALGTQFTISSGVALTPAEPACCGGEAGFVVAWADLAGGDVLARRFSPSAEPAGTAFTVNSFTPGTQERPAVACNDEGEFVVVWESSESEGAGQDGDGHGIFGQAFATGGKPVGTELQANTYTTSDQRNPAVTMDGAGRFVVTWDSVQLAGRRGIFAQAFGADAAALGTELRADGSGQHPDSSDSSYASIASVPGGDFVVVWQNDEDEGSGEGVFARLYDFPSAVTTTTVTTSTTIPAAVCGDPVEPAAFAAADLPSSVTASDALFVLTTAVGGETCQPCVCDVDGSGAITATDALITLKVAVGQSVALNCPACAS